jgi:hypothetical protein
MDSYGEIFLQSQGINPMKLNLTINEPQGHQPPNRRLELRCEIRNRTQNDICILNAWTRVDLLNDVNLAEGNLFYSTNNLVDPAAISAGQQGFGAIVIPLTDRVLAHIEQRRTGGDVSIRIYSRLLIASISKTENISLLGVPYEAQFENKGSVSVDYTIPQSEWIKVLRALGWSELEAFEIPSAKLKATPGLQRSIDRFTDAQECHRRGDWDEAMVNCRKAFEAIIKDTTREEDLAKAAQAFAAIIGNELKADKFNKMVIALGNFLHLARHEQLSPVQMKQPDSLLALHLTGAMLAYLGGQ